MVGPWEQKKQIKQRIDTYTYHCFKCGEPLFSVSCNTPIPSGKTKERCIRGHINEVPNFKIEDRIKCSD